MDGVPEMKKLTAQNHYRHAISNNLTYIKAVAI
jgi:hypothetical protein